MNASSLKLGFVGLGIMGAPMAGHLLTAGHQLFVNTLGKIPRRSPRAAPPSAPRRAAWPSGPTSSS